ncbi:DUF4335 domain-containing protein [Candidatus Synechococcus calcipolaris G9]|uniref:DUF4335 domain-containing protein n=1 Tax=Candidatus Synechococcus calcipolaris G9 TaxID=1497997 RepID=A0ABT6F0H2_9SYNE|nr:DUF4335 domain-containing protein [Candidatus Synechococcus calcipolaris]MDG2991359.1 DUF4335 domain-containing protein [Candidatus Synechococcus calcipolaris G9]
MKRTLTYEQPSCTLDVAANVLPLGNRLPRQPVRSLQFKLIVRPDPSKPEHSKNGGNGAIANGYSPDPSDTIELTGNDQDLYQLATVVEDYVQALLIRRSPSLRPPEAAPVEQNHHNLSDLDSLGDLDDVDDVESQVHTPDFDIDSLDFDAFPEDMLEPDPEEMTDIPLIPLNLPPPEKVIYLESETPLCHRLYLGPLATPDSGEQLKLRLTELFDLATVLEEWSAMMQPLPELLATSRSQLERLPIWARSAAVALVVLGLSAALIQLVERPVLISQDAAEAPEMMEPGIDSPVILPPLDLEQSPLPPPRRRS